MRSSLRVLSRVPMRNFGLAQVQADYGEMYDHLWGCLDFKNPDREALKKQSEQMSRQENNLSAAYGSRWETLFQDSHNMPRSK